MLQTSLGKYLAPTSMGAGYAISKVLLLRWFDTELALLQDFTMQFLAGVLIGFSLRPVIKVIYWKPTTGFVMISLIMLVFGTLGNVLLNFVWGTPMDPWILGGYQIRDTNSPRYRGIGSGTASPSPIQHFFGLDLQETKKKSEFTHPCKTSGLWWTPGPPLLWTSGLA